MNMIIDRLKEPSTWRGLVWIMTAFGITVSPDVAEYIATAGMAIAGLIGVLISDTNSEK